MLLENSEDNPRAIDARLIWQAEFDEVKNIDDVQVPAPSNVIPELRFASSMGELELSLRNSPTGHIILTLNLAQNDHTALEDFPFSDQIIVDDTWYCLDTLAVKALFDQFGSLKINLNKPLTAAEVLTLQWKESITSRIDYSAKIEYLNKGLESLGSLVHAHLYPYQESGASRLIGLSKSGLGGLLADEMGLGKTLQIITVLASYGSEGRSLVVCPASVVSNWHKEITKFAPHLTVHKHQGPKRAGSSLLLSNFNVVITSYETMIQDIHFLKGINWTSLSFDEAQYLKNPTTKRYKNVGIIPRKTTFAISGTPIENSLRDLWSIVQLIAPNFLPDLDTFISSYPDESWAASALGHRISPLVIRRTIEEVASSLPERIDSFIPVEMSRVHALTYDKVLSSDMPALAKLTTLRTCSSDLDPQVNNLKHQYLLELCSDIFSMNRKALIFASFSQTIDIISKSLKEYGPGLHVSIIDGRTPVSDRQDMIDAFSAYNGPAVLVLNPRAAGVGLNIQAASYVIHFNPEWNPAVVDQASARSYRTGQDKTVFVYYLYFENTIEQIMIERLEKKRQIQSVGMDAASIQPSPLELDRILKLSPIEEVT